MMTNTLGKIEDISCPKLTTMMEKKKSCKKKKCSKWKGGKCKCGKDF